MDGLLQVLEYGMNVNDNTVQLSEDLFGEGAIWAQEDRSNHDPAGAELLDLLAEPEDIVFSAGVIDTLPEVVEECLTQVVGTGRRMRHMRGDPHRIHSMTATTTSRSRVGGQRRREYSVDECG